MQDPLILREELSKHRCVIIVFGAKSGWMCDVEVSMKKKVARESKATKNQIDSIRMEILKTIGTCRKGYRTLKDRPCLTMTKNLAGKLQYTEVRIATKKEEKKYL